MPAESNRQIIANEGSRLDQFFKIMITFANAKMKMMKENPKHIRIDAYNYPLPDERIAKYPLPTRDQSKLLIYRQGEVSEDVFTSLPEYLPEGA
ncbi:S-adenosylmethionine:tRNA ribosyltransferase-isomerase [Bacteroides reticulotermitis JCM 10512]|uniref:S-adenosylmethionine:tRNA ribosyltransferase-isomerase n=1 Tax=Bacteroides reticulotermitis JCM 10512 TaxID=1445607 RepID=W4UNK3_9BACE|nr:S-adenosylmethionine:tRNA ribosyltransferase-isomerase [Bacteroides reticulotermitis JCM 10512]